MSRVEPERNKYVGHRYVPKIFGEWDKQNEYEGLSIVTHQGASYTSKKRVPVGIDISNEEFWVVTGNYNAQVEYYREETKRVAKDLLLKADQTYVDTELGKKADQTYVNTELNKKANKTYVDTELGKKADKSYTDTELGKKSDKIYVDTELGKKADKSYTDTELGKKADITYVDYEFDGLNAQLTQKVQKGGNEQVTWGMLDQKTKENITGGNTAVVGVDSVNTTNIVNGAVTSAKTNFDSLSINKGKVFPFENRGTDENGRFNLGFLDIKVYQAQEGAIYRVSHVSKDNTAWGDPITYFEVGKSVDHGATWKVLIARGNLNLPNNQSGVKSHTLTLDNLDEIFVIVVDWEGFTTGSNNMGIYDYIISPINYIYAPKEEEVIKEPPYMANKGQVYPLLKRGTEDNGFYKNAILDAKVQVSENGAIYRIEHISKNNTTWGSALTFIQFQRSYDNGTTWETITTRTNSLINEVPEGIKAHIITHNGIDEIFTVVIDWDALSRGDTMAFNIGSADYIIHPNLYFFRRSSNSGIVNDLGDNIVAKKTGRQIQIKQRLDDNRNFIVEYNSVGINNFNEFRAFYIQPNTAKDNDFRGTQVGQSGTDWISPYGMLAVNNPVSGSAGSVTVGGSHGTTAGQGFPTGEFIQLSRCHVDGVELSTAPIRGKHLELTSEHYISASNVVNKTTGAKRNTAIERRIYDIYGNGNHNVTVEIEALEDITMTRYAGFMMPMLSAFFTHFYLYDTGGEIGLFRSGGLPEGLPDGIYHTENKDYQAIDRAVLVNDDMLLVMLTDRTFGIGTGEHAPPSTADKPQSPILYTGGQFGKISAHNLGGSSNEYLVRVGEKISYRGGYHFVDYTQTQENVFEYEINGVKQIDDLRGD